MIIEATSYYSGDETIVKAYKVKDMEDVLSIIEMVTSIRPNMKQVEEELEQDKFFLQSNNFACEQGEPCYWTFTIVTAEEFTRKIMEEAQRKISAIL